MQQIQNQPEPAQDVWFSTAEYYDAIVKLGKSVTPIQRRMLVAHAEAPGCILSVLQGAEAAGYKNANPTYLQYGGLANRLATALNVTGRWKVWTHLIGKSFRTEKNDLCWEMHPELVGALIKLNWVRRDAGRSS